MAEPNNGENRVSQSDGKADAERDGPFQCPLSGCDYEGDTVRSIQMHSVRSKKHDRKLTEEEILNGEMSEEPVSETEEEEVEEPEEREAPQGDEEKEPEMYEKARSPTEVLEDILGRYTSRSEPKKHLTKSSEIRGGFHPADLKNKLQNYNQDWLGFSKNLIPDLVEEYSYALQREQEKADKLGEDITYPVGSVRGSFRSSERRPSGYRGTSRKDRTYDRSSRFRERSREDDTIDKAIKLMDKIEERAGDSGETEELREELHNLKLEMVERDNEHDLEMLEKEIENLKERQQVSQRNRYDVISEAMDKLSKVLVPHLRFQNQILAKKYGLEMPQEEAPEREREEGSRGMLSEIKPEYVE